MRLVMTCAIVALCATSLPAIAKNRAAPPLPKGSPGDWFPPNSYPAQSKRKGEQGRVSIELSVNASGMATACRVVGSSGFSGLDLATCDLAIANARFVPGRDARGRPVEAKYTLPGVRWELKDDVVNMDLSAGPITTTIRNIEISVDEKGMGVSCRPLASSEGVNVGCEAFRPGTRMTPPLQLNGIPTAGKVTITTTMRVDPK